MRAMAVTRYGAPLERIDVPEPELAPGHALLEVITCGVCFSDVKTSRGLMPFSEDLPLPHVPGHEIFGRVLATEPDGLIAEGVRRSSTTIGRVAPARPAGVGTKPSAGRWWDGPASHTGVASPSGSRFLLTGSFRSQKGSIRSTRRL